MMHRQSLPRVWLVTDERQGEQLLTGVARLPRGSGILFRHYSLPPTGRRRLFDRVARLARRGDHMLLLAGSSALAHEWGADGWHGREAGTELHSAPVHDRRELRQAEADGAALLFLSPLFATRSHPGAATLGTRRFKLLARMARRPVIALGGVGPHHASLVRRLGAHGWAGVDAWLV